MRRALPLLVLLFTACTPPPRDGAGTSCGIAAVAGPAMLISEFGTAGAPLSVAPPSLPARIVARFVAGPAAMALVGQRGDSLEIGVEGGTPAGTTPGFGVLVMAPDGTAQGVLIYEGTPVLGAPVLGSVTAGATRAPLLGITVPRTRIEDPRCPFFPDSLLR